MKTKMFSRCAACLLSVAMFFAMIIPTAFADEMGHASSSSLLNGANYAVSYSMNGRDVIEQLTFYDQGVTRITRTIRPDNTMKIMVEDASGQVKTTTTTSDYELFYSIYKDQQNFKNGTLGQIPSLTGSEVTGSQFKHRRVGQSATDTVYASDLRKCKKASDIAGILAVGWGNTPAAVISATASFIFDQMLQSMSADCYKVTMSSTMYEVLFVHDNSYYTHCYHQTINEYRSNGSLIRSEMDYYQAIGG